MRVLEATAAGVVVFLVVALIAWRADGDPLLAGGVGFLVGFGAWMASGKTSQHYGSGSLRIGGHKTRRRRRRY